MKKTMTVILAIALVFLMMNGAPAKTYLSPYELLGKIKEDCIYLMDPEVTMTTTMVQEDNEEEDYPLVFTETVLCHGRLCELKISGTQNGTDRVMLRVQPEQLRMGDEGQFPAELSMYHKIHYAICSNFPAFYAIDDGYGIELLLDSPGEAYYDNMAYQDEKWTWITREPMHFSLSVYSERTEFGFSVEGQPDGTVLITWTVND